MPIRKTHGNAAGLGIFATVQTPSGTSPVADSVADILSLLAGPGITITGDAATDSITFTATGANINITTKNSNYTTTPSDDVIFCTGTFTLTLHASLGSTKQVYVKNIGTGVVTVTRSGSDTIEGETSLDMGEGVAYDFTPDGASGWWIF